MTRVAIHQFAITKNTTVEFRGEGANYHDAHMEASRQATTLIERLTAERDRIRQAAQQALAPGYNEEPEDGA
jgi:hypothetical protein